MMSLGGGAGGGQRKRFVPRLLSVPEEIDLFPPAKQTHGH